MKGHNPLFVDSTKFAGDGIRTQFELTRVLLHDGETLFARVINMDQHQQIVPLHEQQPSVFSGSIYLRHQEEVRFEFFIKKGEKTILKSREYKGRASYLVSEVWDPLPQKLFVEPVLDLKPVPSKRVLTEPLPEFEAQKKSLLSAVEALQNFFPESSSIG